MNELIVYKSEVKLHKYLIEVNDLFKFMKFGISNDLLFILKCSWPKKVIALSQVVCAITFRWKFNFIILSAIEENIPVLKANAMITLF